MRNGWNTNLNLNIFLPNCQNTRIPRYRILREAVFERVKTARSNNCSRSPSLCACGRDCCNPLRNLTSPFVASQACEALHSTVQFQIPSNKSVMNDSLLLHIPLLLLVPESGKYHLPPRVKPARCMGAKRGILNVLCITTP